jgi:hypothetical protein
LPNAEMTTSAPVTGRIESRSPAPASVHARESPTPRTPAR